MRTWHALGFASLVQEIILKIQANSSPAHLFRVSSACFDEPGFTQNNPNKTELCTDGFFENSYCEISAGIYRICECFYDDSSPFMIPDCSWHRLLIATETTATEITATGTTPTEGTSYSTTTFSSAVISSAPEQGCSTIHSPGNGTISCDDEKCRIRCDPGHVPWQLRFTPETCQTVTRFYTKIETKIWKKTSFLSFLFYFLYLLPKRKMVINTHRPVSINHRNL